eukprot:1148988-Pelagomonas_calceolata.AAC.4
MMTALRLSSLHVCPHTYTHSTAQHIHKASRSFDPKKLLTCAEAPGAPQPALCRPLSPAPLQHFPDPPAQPALHPASPQARSSVLQAVAVGQERWLDGEVPWVRGVLLEVRGVAWEASVCHAVQKMWSRQRGQRAAQQLSRSWARCWHLHVYACVCVCMHVCMCVCVCVCVGVCARVEMRMDAVDQHGQC